MKTKNQTEQYLLELAVATAANEDGISPPTRDGVSATRNQAWSPLEVWRTRVKTPAPTRTESAQIQG
ncbi:MAG TPA: hypothetical protein VEW08_16590 [Steroidobacteraceae bacterium]|nr:hypothetical protein [Steroidobacteraceae bacterium]